MNNINTILNTDSYKFSHYKQHAPGTQKVFSYIESRGGKFERTVFYGLQAYLKEYLSHPITRDMIDEAEQFASLHFGRTDVFNRAGWEHILNKHGGYLPVVIHAVPEGLVIPTKNCLVTVENTDQNVPWLTSYLETSMLRAVWYGTTVATNSYSMKQTIKKWLEKTGDVSLLPSRMQDFGARGVSSFESNGIASSGHLINFMGTDSIEGILFAQRYYNTKEMLGYSIPASEHSTISSWGGREGELAAMENMLDQFAQTGKLVACVSDTYDIYHAIIQHWGTTLRHKIWESGATLVVRPDSGDPVEVTLECVKLLANKFSTCINEKGYKVLNPAVRLIQGDGIDGEMIDKILANFAKHGFSADNIAFGSGGALLQKVDRDTCKFAMKCSAVKVNGVYQDVFKDPITDPGKKSKKGLLTLWKSETTGEYITAHPQAYADQFDSVDSYSLALKKVFENGKIIKEYNFEQVRANSEKA